MLSELMYKEWVCEVKCLKQDFGQSKICVRERTFNVGCAQETESSLSLLLIELNIGSLVERLSLGILRHTLTTE